MTAVAGEWRIAALRSEVAMLREHVGRNHAAARSRRQARERKRQAWWDASEAAARRGRAETLMGVFDLLNEMEKRGAGSAELVKAAALMHLFAGELELHPDYWPWRKDGDGPECAGTR